MDKKEKNLMKPFVTATEDLNNLYIQESQSAGKKVIRR